MTTPTARVAAIPQQVAEQEAIAADRAYNDRKAERLCERDADRALDLQQRHAAGELK